MCKLGQGLALPVLVQVVEDCIDDPFATGVVVEAGDGTGSSTDLPEAAFDGVGRARHAVVLGRAVEEIQEGFEVALQAGDCFWGLITPAPGPGPVGLNGFASGLCRVDVPGAGQTLFLLAALQAVRDVAEFVYPAMLARNVREDRVQSFVETGATVGDDELQVAATQAPLTQVAQEHLPLCLALGRPQPEAKQPARVQLVPWEDWQQEGVQ